ncbi:MAG TPA: 2-C-methyl-D-erythritol 2,4-cyclodiphosphate synthase [Bacteroidetes bacterium]|nr:2-C-methyl-D-erythritol 2,4-cyclodiphosphate synthase [Bacteroidota bacterium]
MARVGIGYDVHRLIEGRPLFLGGVQIPFAKGLAGHSDADVLCHAIIDAILGAANLGDIGAHFPDSQPEWKDRSGLFFLRRVKKLIDENRFGIVNVDATVLAEQPKLRPLIPQMAENIAGALGIETSVVSVKATTTEGLGYIGEGKGIAAQAVVSLTKKPGIKRKLCQKLE